MHIDFIIPEVIHKIYFASFWNGKFTTLIKIFENFSKYSVTDSGCSRFWDRIVTKLCKFSQRTKTI